MDADDARAARFKRAVFSQDSAALRELFAAHPELSGVIDEPWFHFGKPAIVQAAGCRDRELVDTLLDLGADIDARSAWQPGPYSALHTLVDGATEESLALADHMAARGAEVDIHAAAGMGRVERIEEILATQPDLVSEPGPDGATPLHLAKDVTIAALLLDYGADIDKRCIDHKSTPAMWAMDRREDVVRFLVENGARPDLYMAVVLDDVALAEEILQGEPSAIDVRVRFGASREHLGFGDKYVWALGGPSTPIELARVRSKPATYAFLLERSSPAVRLVQASRREDTHAMRGIFAADPGLLARTEDRYVCEALYGSVAGARVMVEYGADPSVRDDQGAATALHHAAWRGLADLARTLLELGADPYARDHGHSATPLGWANENNQTELMEILLEHNPPDIVDAAWLGDAQRVRDILAADPSLVDGLSEGAVSPLRSAAWCGKTDVVRVLLEHGADRSIRHVPSGKAALDFAIERGHDDIVALLSQP